MNKLITTSHAGNALKKTTMFFAALLIMASVGWAQFDTPHCSPSGIPHGQPQEEPTTQFPSTPVNNVDAGNFVLFFISSPYLAIEHISTSDQSGDYIMVIFNGDQLAYGPTPLSWTPSFIGDYFIYFYDDNACGTDAGYTRNTTLSLAEDPCTGTPNPGNTVSTANPVASGVNFTLSLENATSGSGVTYQWQSSLDNTTWTAISGATSHTYTGSQTVNTYYHCIVSCGANTGTSNTLQITMDGSSAINFNENASAVLFYPNPFNDQIIIQTQYLNSDNAMITLRDITGRVVLQNQVSSENMQHNIMLDVSHLSQGIYTIEFNAGELIKVEKILK